MAGYPRNTADDDQGGLRVDVGPNEKHRISIHLVKEEAPVEAPGLYPLSGTLYLNAFSMAALDHAWTITPRVANTLRVGFLRSVAVGGNQSQTPLLNSMGIFNTFGNRGISVINPAGYSSIPRQTWAIATTPGR